MNNNKHLKRLMERHHISIAQTAKMLSVADVTVARWRQKEGSSGYNPMPDNMLELLRLKLER